MSLGADGSLMCDQTLRRCSGASILACSDGEFFCSGCAGRIDRNDARHPDRRRARRRTKPKRARKTVLGEGDRTHVNAPPLGHHPATLPQRVWW